ncbi:single-stranded DNA-binding protein [Nocardioides sp. R-C-SC26]|uniref:single-stranded DNA-binding protein n=1 Tax=Nocardioides sp. R-C-SC26 TaxID=2870414 RepID=UPI001E5BFFB5|nr:single-stranded DNA-binding protein [Nocardioides sp. R-C-SC26]
MSTTTEQMQNKERSPAGPGQGRNAHDPADVAVNEVRLVGRVSAVADERVLPSGDRLVGFRLAVDRPATTPGRQRVDALECAAWSPRCRRSASRWRVGDVVEVEGALRRRFFQTGAGAASRVEVEVSAARLVRRSRDA